MLRTKVNGFIIVFSSSLVIINQYFSFIPLKNEKNGMQI